jgi:hypothetical protein
MNYTVDEGRVAVEFGPPGKPQDIAGFIYDFEQFFTVGCISLIQYLLLLWLVLFR